MFRSKKNRRKPNHGRRAKFSLAAAAACGATLCILLHAQAQDAEIARIEAQPQQHKAKQTPTPTPPAQPIVPAGLLVGARSIDRQDDRTPPAAAELNGFNLSAMVSHGAHGRVSVSKTPVWIESDQASHVVVCLDAGVLALDALQPTADVLSVRVHDEKGNVVTFAERAYRTPYDGAVDSVLCAVRLDAKGNLLPLAVVRVIQGKDGSVRVTRDSDFSEPLIVHYRLHRAGDNPRSYLYSQNVIIPAGAASAALPVTGKAGDMLTLAAGFSYTPAPLENSDVIDF